jgi:hypothetical protein
MIISNEQHNELLQALLAEIPQPLQPHEVTIEMVREASGLSSEGARNLLERKVREGELVKRKATHKNGIVVSAYRKVEK